MKNFIYSIVCMSLIYLFAPTGANAAITWLPDWQINLRGNTNPDPGGGDVPTLTGKCETYGLTTPESVDTTKYFCDKYDVKPLVDLTCYQNCRCKPNITPGVGEQCALFCSSNCVKTACKSPVYLSYTNDRCTEKCAADSTVCTAKTCDSSCTGNSSLTCTGADAGTDGCGKTCKQCCSDVCSNGSTSSTCGTNQLAYANGIKTGCGGTCYSCRAKTCSDGGYQSSTNGLSCTSVSYAGLTCYKDCRCSDTCSSGSTSASCSSNQTSYYNGSTTQCGSPCYSCRAKTCADGGYSSSTGGNICTSVSYAGLTCYKDCRCDDNCPSGSKVACTSNQVQTSSSTTGCGSKCYSCRAKTCADGGYQSSAGNQICSTVSYGGNTCYSGCRNRTCSDGGYVNSCPSGQSGTAVSYYGSTCYTGCKNSCVPTPSESGCRWGTSSVSDGCGGTRTTCLPACTIGYKYNYNPTYDCFVRPARHMYQPSNRNCGKCVCDNSTCRTCSCMIV